MSRITSLQVENIKRLKAIHVDPKGSMIVVGGKNDQGKSSVLDSIMYALNGGKSIPSKPLRNGAKKGSVKLNIGGTEHGDLIVERTFTERGSALVIKTKDGYEAPTPQKILDDMCGKLAFDPLDFARQKPKDQLAILRDLVGIDFGAIDLERGTVFQTRTSVNREVKQLEGELAGLPFYEDAPELEVSLSKLADELQAMNDANRVNENHRRRAIESAALIEREESERDRILAQIEELQAKALKLSQVIDKRKVEHAELQAKVEALVDQDIAPVRHAMQEAEGTNKKVQANARRADVEAKLVAAEEKAATLTARLEAIDADKLATMEKAKFPVPGLGFSDEGITLNGLPFEQASSSQRIKVSAAMGLAMNPDLRVMLIRDGSLLDEATLAVLAEMAEEADAQVWVERVSTGEEVSVVIEDGSVLEDRTKELAATA